MDTRSVHGLGGTPGIPASNNVHLQFITASSLMGSMEKRRHLFETTYLEPELELELEIYWIEEVSTVPEGPPASNNEHRQYINA